MDMFKLIKEFPEQLMEALAIGKKAHLDFKNKAIKNIVVSGLGGSGIGGSLLAELLRENLSVPVIVNKGYSLPAFIDNSSLVILCSYSGNTEETIACANQALTKGLKPVCITSGGKLGEIALKNNLPQINIPGGFPPRACLGYSVVQLFYVLHYCGLIDDKFKEQIKGVAAFLKEQQPQLMKGAEALSVKLQKKLIIVYAEDKYESTALRLKQQINENGKMHCWYNILPELNHNELVGWREPNHALAVLIFRTDDAYPRNTHRAAFTKNVVQKINQNIFEIEAGGTNLFEKHFHLIHWGDWFSYYLAIQQGFDPMEIEVLNRLKNHMASIVN